MQNKYLLFSLEDESSKNLGEIISSPTCKKIVNLLAEKDLSESDIARELSLPINTIEYNLKKLLEAGIIEKAKNFFWSRKGRKIDIYKVANKLIVISPKKYSNIYSKIKSIIPVAIISGILTSFIAWYYKKQELAQLTLQKTTEYRDALTQASSSVASSISQAPSDSIQLFSSLSWEWFLAGSLITIIIFLIWNWKKL